MGVLHSIVYSHISTWEREIERIERQKPKVSYVGMLMQNIMVHYFFLNIFIVVSVYTLFGTGGLKFHLAYAAWKVTFLEAGNYGEHYGLERTKDANGVYESIRC